MTIYIYILWQHRILFFRRFCSNAFSGNSWTHRFFFVTRNADFGQFRNPCKWRCIAGQINYKWWILRYILDHQRVFFPAIFLQGLKQTSQFSHSANIEKYGGGFNGVSSLPRNGSEGKTDDRNPLDIMAKTKKC